MGCAPPSRPLWSTDEDDLRRAIDFMAAVQAMPRWRRWLWRSLPGCRLTYPLIEALAPTASRTEQS